MTNLSENQGQGEAPSITDDIMAAIRETAQGDDVSPSDDPHPPGDGTQPVRSEGADELAPEQTDSPKDDGDAFVAAPEHWPEDDRKRFEALGHENQEWWLNKTKSLERGYQDKFERLGEARRESAALSDALAPYEAQLARVGLDRVGLVQQLVASEQMLRTNPDEALAWLAQLYPPRDRRGAMQKIARALGADSGDATGQAAATEASASEDVINQVRSELDRHMQQFASAQHSGQIAAIATQFDSMRAMKDEGGNERFPHLNQVRAVMAALVAAGAAYDLPSAYDMAVRAQGIRDTKTGSDYPRSDAQRRQSVQQAKIASRKPQTDSAPARKVSDGRGPVSIQDAILESIEEYRAGL